MTTLTQFEYAELIDHLQQSPTLWMQSEENPSLWLRSADDVNGCALQFSEAPPFYAVDVIPIAWSAEETSLYLHRVLQHWTTLRMRQASERFLREEMKLPPSDAEMLGLALTQLEYTEPDGPDPDLPDLPVRVSPPDVGLFQIQGGGYVELRFHQGFLHVTLSIPSRRQHLSFGPVFTGLMRGVVRSHGAKTEDVASAISEGDGS